MNDKPSRAASEIQFLSFAAKDVPDCYVCFRGSSLPTLVAVHGISRNAAEIALKFASHPAFQTHNIVSPLFERRRFGKYQQLLPRASRMSADKALFNLFATLHENYGLLLERPLLFGFSGGAQMAHRLAMLFPHRFGHVCAAAAGWYLMPNWEQNYPVGLAGHLPEGATPQDMFENPITILVGDRDKRKDKSVRDDELIMKCQGRHRLARAKTWVKAMTAKADAEGKSGQVKLVMLQNGTHSFKQCVSEAKLLDRVAEVFGLAH